MESKEHSVLNFIRTLVWDLQQIGDGRIGIFSSGFSERVHLTLLTATKNKKSIFLKESSVFKIELSSSLTLNFSHLHEYQFLTNFIKKVDLKCTWITEPEPTFHYLLHCNLWSTHELDCESFCSLMMYVSLTHP